MEIDTLEGHICKYADCRASSDFALETLCGAIRKGKAVERLKACDLGQEKACIRFDGLFRQCLFCGGYTGLGRFSVAERSPSNAT